MNQNNLKTMWEKAHESQSDNIPSRNILRTLIKKPHANLISKTMKDLKLKITIYIFSLITLICLVLYGFVYLKIQLTTSIGIPFLLAGLFLSFKSGSELIRYLVLNSQRDTQTIKEANLFFSKRLRSIKVFDFYIHLFLFYAIAFFFLLGYLFDIGGLKNWTQSANLSGLLIIFILSLFISPWLMRKFYNQQYKEINTNLQSSIDYLTDEGS